jgi:hypothetical protein
MSDSPVKEKKSKKEKAAANAVADADVDMGDAVSAQVCVYAPYAECKH